MMKRLLPAGIALLVSILLPVFAETGSTNVASSVAKLTQIVREGRSGVPFEITATIIYPYTKQMHRCAVQDATGAIMLEMTATSPENRLSKGDRVHIRGTTKSGFRGHSCHAIAKTAEVLYQAPIPSPVEADATGLAEGRFENKLVRFRGTVVDAFLDDIDPLCGGGLVLRSGHESIYACFAPSPAGDDMNDLIGAEIAVTGFYSELITEPRFHSGQFILISGRDAISVIRPAPDDPFDVPPLAANQHDRAAVISSMEDGRLLFSVQDDGCGFDPDNAPGVQQGHFGLQGIRERVNRFGGEMSVHGQPGKGTKVAISLALAHVEDEEWRT